MARPPKLLQRFFEGLCEERLYAIGAQVAVVDTNGASSWSFGEHVPGQKLTDRHLFNVWCASKPIVATLLIASMEDIGLDAQVFVGDVLPGTSESVASTSWSAVLNHSAGLTTPSLTAANLMPADEATEAALSAVATPSPAYSDFVCTVLMVRAIERIRAGAIQSELRTHLDAHGLGNDVRFGLGSVELGSPFDHIGFYIRGLPDRSVPLYHDAIGPVACNHRAIFGAYANAYGLARWYARVGEVLDGHHRDGFPTPTTLRSWLDRRRGVGEDLVLGRRCDFAAGYMVDLPTHAFGDAVSGNAIGHSGLAGSPFAFHDPATGLSVGVILNGVGGNLDDLEFLRPVLIRTIVESVSA